MRKQELEMDADHKSHSQIAVKYTHKAFTLQNQGHHFHYTYGATKITDVEKTTAVL